VISGVLITTPEELRPALPSSDAPGAALREQEAASSSVATVRRVKYMSGTLNGLTLIVLFYPAAVMARMKRNFFMRLRLYQTLLYYNVNITDIYFTGHVF